MPAPRLVVRRDTLTELTTAELDRVDAGRDDTVSCQTCPTIRPGECIQRLLTTIPPRV